ncbi:collagen alpha-1(I) chain-like isoform X1 [Gallus gallus]|uniref:collagen alpha-1(I) chain-like isoform X1 n=1 Tax=Gallus gallus TaxID=9031 RepID=UPI001AE23A86|nr:collagen alpha-1(I) chain-like isoform X1 [Gallus gallus]
MSPHRDGHGANGGTRGRRLPVSHRWRTRPADSTGAGEKRNGGDNTGEGRGAGRGKRGAARRRLDCVARFGSARFGPAAGRGARTCIAAAVERSGPRAQLSAQRCIAALQEPPPSPRPSPPAAASQLRERRPGTGRPRRSGQLPPPPPRVGHRDVPNPGALPWGGGHVPPRCARADRGCQPPAFSDPHAGAGSGPDRPVPSRRDSPSCPPSPDPRCCVPIPEISVRPRPAPRSVGPEPLRPPRLAWAKCCPAPSQRAARSRVGSKGWSGRNGAEPTGAVSGSRGGPSGRCPTGRSAAPSGHFAARGVGGEKRAAPRSRRAGRRGTAALRVPRLGTAAQEPVPAGRDRVPRGSDSRDPRPLRAQSAEGSGDPGGKELGAAGRPGTCPHGGARAPPGMCRRSPAPPGWAPVQPQLQKMAARRSPLNPAGGGGGGGDGEEAAARPSPAAAPPGARGRRRGGGREPAGRPERSPESVRSLPPGPHLRRGGGTPSTCRPGRGAAVAHRRAEGTPLPPATWRRPFSRSVGKKENEINKIKPGAAARARRCEAAATPQRKVGPATPRRAAAPRPPPRPFSIVCPRGGGGGRAWERSHRLLPTGVRSPRQRGAVIARVRVSRGRPRNAAAAPRGRDAPRGETAARVGAAGGTERRRTREERGGAGAARGHRERRGEDAGTAAPARHVVRGAARSRGEEKPPVLRGAPVSVSESGFPARARPRGPAVRGVRRVSRRPPAERRRCHRSTALPFPLATRTAAEGQRGAEGAASGRPSGGTGPGVGGWGGAAGGGPGPTGEGGGAGGAAGPFHS